MFRLPVPAYIPYMGIRFTPYMFPRGFSVNFVLLTWSIFGGILIHAMLANFRGMLLSPVLEEPVDTAQQILDRGMITGRTRWSSILGLFTDAVSKTYPPETR